ncbi:hypothetical protein QFZ25_000371 [Bacillus atrophaeus]|nr:hypothetical protein [Bacillus atrophaeus]
MKTQGAFVVVCNKEQGILLVKRKDVPLWDCPAEGLNKMKQLKNGNGAHH